MIKPKILVVGDGLVGMSAVLALAHKPVSLSWVGPQLGNLSICPDHRSIVLNAVSQRVLSGLAVWQSLASLATPIKRVVISDRGRWGKCRFSAEEAQLDALGYVVPAHALLSELQASAERVDCERIKGKVAGLDLGDNDVKVDIQGEHGRDTWQADVILAADGVNSSIRELQNLAIQKKQYQQTAITCQVSFGQEHDHTAYERFTPHGPIAMLPREGGHYGVVWVVKSDHADTLLAMSDQDFLNALQQAFGTQLGLMLSVTSRQMYPLGLSWMKTPVGNRVAYLGNAAQTLHPVMGQGFNLGLRDVMAWTKAGESCQWQHIGRKHRLFGYANDRERDRKRVMQFSDQVVTQFSHDIWPLTWGRNLALGLVDILPGAKPSVARLSMGEVLF